MHGYYILDRNMGRNTNSANVFIVLMMMMMISWSLEKGIATSDEADYHTLPLSSMLPPFVCNPTTSTGPSRKASMKVVHRFGPCSTRGQDSPTMSEFLRYDKSRVKSIQARLKSLNQKANNTSSDESSKAVKLPATLENPGGVGTYVVTVGLGTPENKLDLIFDTGSDITWTQCQPCGVRCYKQRAPIFNPANSTTYSNVPYNSSSCSGLLSATGYPPRNSSKNTCIYSSTYADGSYSYGYFSKDNLTLTSTDIVDGFFFGCGINNDLFKDKSAGIMGLGSDPLSIVSQTSQQYGKYFSYCLPTKQSNNGHLTFGKSNNSNVTNDVRFTPLVSLRNEPSLYFIDILSISVNGRQLPINSTVFKATLIDSGTVSTYLPPTAYAALRDGFRREMTMYPMVQSNSTTAFDTCYNFTNYPNPKIPMITFTFRGNVVVNLDPKGVMSAVNDSPSRVCLVFFGNEDANEVGIFGSYQQQTLEVVYDVPNKQVGFAAGGCS